MPVPQPVIERRSGDAADAAALAAGDEAALVRLYETHAPTVLAVAWRVIGDRYAAEEVCQEVFTHVWQHPGGYDAARGSLSTWLAVIAYRRAVDWVRRESVRRRGVPGPADDHAGSAEDDAISAVVAGRVREAVDALADQYREVVRLLYFEGRTVRELADALGIPEGTAKTRLRVARQRLADRLGTEGLVAAS